MPRITEATVAAHRVAQLTRLMDAAHEIAEEGGAARTLKAGDSFVLRPGFKGTWEVVETTRKEYVIRL